MAATRRPLLERLFQARLHPCGLALARGKVGEGMSMDRMKRELIAAINGNPDAALELLFAVDEIIADFHEWGPMLQADEDGRYTPETAIVQLEQARDTIKRLAGWAVD